MHIKSVYTRHMFFVHSFFFSHLFDTYTLPCIYIRLCIIIVLYHNMDTAIQALKDATAAITQLSSSSMRLTPSAINAGTGDTSLSARNAPATLLSPHHLFYEDFHRNRHVRKNIPEDEKIFIKQIKKIERICYSRASRTAHSYNSWTSILGLFQPSKANLQSERTISRQGNNYICIVGHLPWTVETILEY